MSTMSGEAVSSSGTTPRSPSTCCVEEERAIPAPANGSTGSASTSELGVTTAPTAAARPASADASVQHVAGKVRHSSSSSGDPDDAGPCAPRLRRSKRLRTVAAEASAPTAASRPSAPASPSPPTVRRALFGPPTPDSTRRALHEQTRSVQRDQRRRWNFDFQTEQPLAGRYKWQQVTSLAAPTAPSAAGDGTRSGGGSQSQPTSGSEAGSPAT